MYNNPGTDNIKHHYSESGSQNLARKSNGIETRNTPNCTACTIHSQYMKQVCEIQSTILTQEQNMQMSKNKANFKTELRF
jgi:hypothetical protein